MNNVLAMMESNRKPAVGEVMKDGLIHCAKCGTPRETDIVNPFTGKHQKVRCLCKCQEKEQQAEKELQLKEERERAIKYAKTRCFGSADYSGYTFENDDCKDEKNSRYARNFAQNFKACLENGQGLLMFGGFGTGKTFHSACIANELISRGYSVIMTSTPLLVERFQRNSYTDAGLFDAIEKCDLLILDDLGAERGTETAKERVYSVIDARYRSKKPLVVSTNLTAEEMRNPTDAQSARIYDRILERCYPMRYNGHNRRKTGVDYEKMRELLECDEIM